MMAATQELPAQLLQRLGPLQRARFPLNKLEERISTKSVDTLMTQIANTGSFGGVGDKASREVESAIVPIYDDFVLMR